MKTSPFILCGLGAAMLCLNPSVSTLRAQSFETGQFVSKERLNINLTVLIQGDTVETEDGTRDMGPTKVRVDNRALLQVFGAPAGSKLVLIDGSSIQYQTGSSDPVDTGMTLQLDSPYVVITKGQHTEDSGDTKYVSKTKYTAQYVANPMLEASSVPDNDPGITGFSLSLVGMAKETVNNKSTETESDFNSRSQHTFLFNGAGNGTVSTTEDSRDVVVSGKISTSGKESESEGGE